MVTTTGHLAFVSQLGVAAADEVREVPVRGVRIERELAVITRRDGVLSPAARAFAARLRRG
jgi:hypothetical protein